MQHGAAVELLARAPVFYGLRGELLGVILQRSRVAYLREGQTIAQAGDPAQAALFVMEGTIRLRDANGADLDSVLGPGAILCDMAMLIETSHIHGAVAQSAATIVGLSRDVIAQLMAEDPRLAAQIAGNIRKNLAAMAQTLRQMDNMLAVPVGAGLHSDGPALFDETCPPGSPAPDFPSQPAAVASHFRSLIDAHISP